MSHPPTAVSRVQDPTKSFRHVVTEVDDTWAVTQDDIALVSPFLNSEMLDLDVTRTRGRTRFVDHGNRSLIVNEEGCSTRAEGLKLLQHVTKVHGSLRACHGSVEFGLGRTGGYDRLHAALVCDGSIVADPLMRSEKVEYPAHPIALAMESGERIVAGICGV